MKIEVGKYTVHGDSLCVWIMESVHYKNRKGEDSIKQVKVGGYSPHFEQLLSSFVRQKGISSESKTIPEQIKEFANIEKDLVEIGEAIGKELDKKKGKK
jgi:hypothetical protein